MKKIIALLIFTLLFTNFAACDDIPGFSASLRGGASDGGGYHNGRIGEEMATQWFTFSVNSVRKAREYNGYASPDGYFLLVAEIWVKSTYYEELPMSLYDFEIQWGAGDNDYGFGIIESEMNETYSLRRGESLSAAVVYVVPADNGGEYSVSYLEVYSDDETGDVYFVYFEDDAIEAAPVKFIDI